MAYEIITWPQFYPDDNGAVLVKTKQTLRSTQNAFKKMLYEIFKKYLTEFSTQ